jgi:hypothetical protein
MAVRAPADAGAKTDHVGEGVDGRVRVGSEGIDLHLERVVDAETAANEVGLDPPAEILVGFALVENDVFPKEIGEVLGRGIGFGEYGGVPVVDGQLAGRF